MILAVPPYWTALPALAVLIGAVHLVKRGKISFLTVLFVLFVGLMFVAGLLPASSKALSRALDPPSASAASISVLQHERVGVFDTVTIQSSQSSALIQWLSDHGYAAPTDVAPVVADYAKEGWVFVAARLHREVADARPSAPHPLSFVFKTPRPVYPLRLTGVGNGSCRIDWLCSGRDERTCPVLRLRSAATWRPYCSSRWKTSLRTPMWFLTP